MNLYFDIESMKIHILKYKQIILYNIKTFCFLYPKKLLSAYSKTSLTIISETVHDLLYLKYIALI